MSIARQLVSAVGVVVAPASVSMSLPPQADIMAAASNADAYGKIAVLFIVCRCSCQSLRGTSRCLRPPRCADNAFDSPMNKFFSAIRE
ncbi:hypothetical protein BCEP27_200020 [Burkholderia cepacia]